MELHACMRIVFFSTRIQDGTGMMHRVPGNVDIFVKCPFNFILLY